MNDYTISYYINGKHIARLTHGANQVDALQKLLKDIAPVDADNFQFDAIIERVPDIYIDDHKGHKTKNTLEQLRQGNGLTVDELANISGVNAAIINGIEKQTIDVITSKDILKLSNALHVNVGDIFIY